MKKKICLVLALLALLAADCFAQKGSQKWQNNELLFVEGGTFRLGESEDFYGVNVTVDGFYMSKYEITIAEFLNVMDYYPTWMDQKWLLDTSNMGVEKYSNAVFGVSWYEAVIYCNKRSVAEGLTPCYAINGSTDAVSQAYYIDITKGGYIMTSINEQEITCNWNANGYRLPTEAEWEYAARGGKKAKTQTIYSGSNFAERVAKTDHKSYEVGTKQPNALGLYDMSGNVSEWCWDWDGGEYAEYSNTTNPRGPAKGKIISVADRKEKWKIYRDIQIERLLPLYERGIYNSIEGITLAGPDILGFRVVRKEK